MRKRIWIKSVFLDWPRMRTVCEILDQLSWKRAYEIWHHASIKLTNNATEMDKVDAITTLKRCLNQRLKQFEIEYKIRPFLGLNNSRYLQLLEKLGLVRPLLLQNLMEIRNEIEHDDKNPPKLEQCLEMLDMVWYFLKSTDAFMKERVTNLSFKPTQNALLYGEKAYFVEIKIDIKRTWKINAHGWLPQENVLMMNAPDCLELLVDKLNTGDYLKKQGEHLDSKDTDLFFGGLIVKLHDRIEFARSYFAADQQF